MIGRAQSPAEGNTSVLSAPGTKRKERDFDEDEGEETNIHVVVRCRGRSDREVRENSGVVVSTSGAKGKNVELSMGPNAISNKTYHFDKVFSPAADQAIVFEDVVAPILNETLAGFNCTIFAYGQTGTGKTYTMSGDMTDTLGLLSDAAGIIPRTLYSLFQRLEADDVECSVKCSFIELYNEELRDLLASDDSTKLKIYDDASRKSHSSTMVQGMEESHIKSAAAGIKLLQKGSYRRQVAATKCNDLSSRSHTVFTITTYIKKPVEGGEDIISAGKLNLVDLAGSENIQRSGAENKRAAEAGLINKSLLTLGRVINALVDKSSHIPYRESKLTRLLQDSLGGRTKTCIIATVSPAKSNLEETISTLDYAFRAKNIRNKPQINSLISKKTLLREFTYEIEKLKGELIATRQRNGVYLSNEQYEDITVESESRRILSEEQKARLETMETSLRNKVQELFNLTNNFVNLKRDNESTRGILDSTKDILFKTDAVLHETKSLLEDETALRKAHEETESRLKDVSRSLMSTVGRTVEDLDGVHSKLRRRSELHKTNKDVWHVSVEQVHEMAAALEQRLDAFRANHENLLSSSTVQLQSFVEAESTKLLQCKNTVTSRLAVVESLRADGEEQSSCSRDRMNSVLEEIKVLREEVKEKVGQGLQRLNHAAEKISGEVISELEQFHTQLHTSYSSLGKDFKTLFDDLTKQLSGQRQENDRLRRELQIANRTNIEASLAASDRLQAGLEEERQASQTERQQLKDQILALIDASAAKQDERMSSTVLQTQTHIVQSTEAFEEAEKSYSEGMDGMATRDEELMSKITKSRDDLKTRMKKDWTSINARNAAIQLSTKAVHEETVKVVDAQLGEMATQMSALDQFVTRARSQNDQIHEQHISGCHNLSQQASELHTDFGTFVAEREDALNHFSEGQSTAHTELPSIVEGLVNDVLTDTHTLKNQFSDAALQEYQPTGQTPQKTDYLFPTELPETANHKSIIARMRGLPDPMAESKMSSASRSPAKSPKKQTSPRKGSPAKLNSPAKSKVYTDRLASSHAHPNMTEPLKELKEIDINVVRPPSDESHTISFSRSTGVGSQPPLKRHATAGSVTESRLFGKIARSKAAVTPGVENLGQGFGPGRRLRSSPKDSQET